jgi:hypothetical protein
MFVVTFNCFASKENCFLFRKDSLMLVLIRLVKAFTTNKGHKLLLFISETKLMLFAEVTLASVCCHTWCGLN